jgi:DNA recombination protein RmuC
MIEGLLIAVAVLLAVAVVLLILLLVRSSTNPALLQLQSKLQSLNENANRLDRSVREEIARNREEANTNSKQVREELSASFNSFGGGIRGQMSDISAMQKSQLDVFSEQLSTLTQGTEQKLERMRETIEARLKLLQDDNTRKLEQMRETVDEKLHATLEQRLGESFKLVSERLELVHKGLGEMQTLAVGVGDLKKVLTNVKARGTWGEVQLGSLLEQVLTPEQYSRNVALKSGSLDRVEYAVKLPGREGQDGTPVWLPIDAKFPQEDYQKLVDAQEQANPQIADEAARQLEMRLKNEAKSIKEKYIDPPHTTDFAIMFLPIESLYAEVLRRQGLFDTLQREYRVVVTGPTTLLAVLNSLQMGFRTLAIQRRASDVWALLGAVKTEFGRFGEILERTKKKLEEASNTVDTAATRSRAIERKLKDVQQLPQQEATQLLGTSEPKEPDNPQSG